MLQAPAIAINSSSLKRKQKKKTENRKKVNMKMLIEENALISAAVEL